MVGQVKAPACGECRLGLGVHNVADPLCELPEAARLREHLAAADELHAAGADWWTAVTATDPRNG